MTKGGYVKSYSLFLSILVAIVSPSCYNEYTNKTKGGDYNNRN